MSASTYDESALKSAEHLLGYFDQQVLAAYRSEPHKYEIESDYFEGELSVTDSYYRELEAVGKTDQNVNIKFGYRTLRDGNLALVAWLPDLFERSKSHVQRWSAFHLKNPEWTTDRDERFINWVRRYLEGDFDVDNGPLHYLSETVNVINGLTSELVGARLFTHELDQTLGYPAAENTHRYQDSHKALYGYLIDGLNKDCISRLAAKSGKSVTTGDKNTVQAITKLLPRLKTAKNFMPAVELISKERRLAAHGVRPPAEHFPAFSQFTKDLFLCLEALKELLAILEQEFSVDGEEALKRHEAKKWLPDIDRPPEGHFSIVQAASMTGKTIERVELGFRKEIKGVHGSEALIIHFTDGSIMGLESGSNAGNIVNKGNGLRPEDFHVDFVVHWVPAPQRKS
jgi:hypothetical protein